MAYETMPVGTKRQDVTFSYRVAHTDNWCRCSKDCRTRFQHGERVVLVRWGGDRDDWGLLIPEHFEALLGKNGHASIPDTPQVAQSSVWYERLPDGHRHRNKHYVVFVDDKDIYYTGIRERAIGAVEFAVAHLGMLDESDDAQERRDP